MIIRLSSQFDRLDVDARSSYITVFELLLNAHIEGAHFFLPTLPLLDWMSGAEAGLSNSQRACAREINENFSFYSGLAKDGPFTVLAFPDGVPLVQERKNDLIQVKLRFFRKPGALQRFHLLVENAENDGNFYKALCAAFARSVGFARSYDFEILHGGGETILAEFRRLASSPRPLLCVVDSDKCSHDCGVSDKVKGLQDISRDEMSPLSDVLVLNSREAENFVPLEICRTMFEGNMSVQNAVQNLSKFEMHDCGCARGDEHLRWFDFKNGLKREDFNRQGLDQHCRDRMKEMWALIDPAESHFDTEDYMPELDVICGGISSRLLEHLAEYVQKPRNRERFRAAVERTFFLRDVRELVSKILGFAVAPDPSRF